MEFKYFPEYQKWAHFSEKPCEICGNSPALNATFFNSDLELEAVCPECLAAGKDTVYVAYYLVKCLVASIRQELPNWEEKQVQALVETTVNELSRTPPVPWIQNNMWPVHHGDFCRYLGEWDQQRLTDESVDGEGKAYLLSILEDGFPVNFIDDLWDSIATDWTAIFAFECLTCHKRIGIEQSY